MRRRKTPRRSRLRGSFLRNRARLEVARVHDNFNAGALAFSEEHVENGAGGVVAEELAESFLVPGNAVAIDEFEEVGGLIERQRGFGEVRIGERKRSGPQ